MLDAHHLDAVRPYACLSTAFDEPAWRDEAGRSNAEPIPRSLLLRIEQPGDSERLLREIALVAPHFDRDRDAVALQINATGMATAAIAALTSSLERHFHLVSAPRAARMIVLHAPRLSGAAAAALADLGFGGVDFATGLADVDATLAAIDDARQAGIGAVGVELSLPALPDGPELPPRLRDLLAAQPDRLSLRLPGSPAGEARTEALATLAAALHAGGYRDIGLDTRPLAWLLEDDVRIGGIAEAVLAAAHAARRIPGEDVDLVSFGIGARSRIGDAVSENLADPDAWSAAVDAGRLPIWRGITLDAGARLRAHVAGQWLRTGEIQVEGIEHRHGIVFSEYFADSLERLRPHQADGLVSCAPWYVRATSRGRLMLRIMARCFDPPAPHR